MAMISTSLGPSGLALEASCARITLGFCFCFLASWGSAASEIETRIGTRREVFEIFGVDVTKEEEEEEDFKAGAELTAELTMGVGRKDDDSTEKGTLETMGVNVGVETMQGLDKDGVLSRQLVRDTGADVVIDVT